jgi:hypothetical protein
MQALVASGDSIMIVGQSFDLVHARVCLPPSPQADQSPHRQIWAGQLVPPAQDSAVPGVCVSTPGQSKLFAHVRAFLPSAEQEPQSEQVQMSAVQDASHDWLIVGEGVSAAGQSKIFVQERDCAPVAEQAAQSEHFQRSAPHVCASMMQRTEIPPAVSVALRAIASVGRCQPEGQIPW